MKTNKGFICPLCGKRNLFPSIVRLEASYGSTYDGERNTVNVCGPCMDRLMGYIQSKSIIRRQDN